MLLREVSDENMYEERY